MADERRIYFIVRMYRDDTPSERVKSGLTLSEARAWCRRDDTHQKDAEGMTVWFDGYDHIAQADGPHEASVG